ncbi:MAG: twin-arginine translocase TatA/TatE family subunit [Deltaproteobacteria bacterium]|nr:twin-arginine translocase TatA/TatE family subunit [Deltaproteobacteria bacterium]
MFGIGMSEMVIILAVALLVFGPQKLPEIAKGIAKGLRELRKAGDDLRSSIDLDDAPKRPAHRAPRPSERTLEEPPAQIPGSALTAPMSETASTEAASTEAAGTENASAETASSHAAPPWPQPAEGTLAQGALESGLAAETPEATGEQTADAPPGEAKGT